MLNNKNNNINYLQNDVEVDLKESMIHLQKNQKLYLAFEMQWKTQDLKKK